MQEHITDSYEIAETLRFQKEALEREQERTRGIIEAAHIGFLVLDGESEEVFLLNRRAKTLLRLRQDFENNYFMTHYRELFPEKIGSIIEKTIIKIRAGRAVVNLGDSEIEECCILNFTAYPILIGDSISSIVIMTEDVTEKKVLEQQILQSSRLADIGELAAVVGHEINNPIAFITGNTSTMIKYLEKVNQFMTELSGFEKFLDGFIIDERKILDMYQGVLSMNQELDEWKKKFKELKARLKIDKAIKNIGDILKENLEGLDRVKKIVIDLKTLSYMGEEKLEEADLNKVMDDSIQMVWSQIKFKAAVNRKFSVLPLLWCYPRQISQVFTNLIVNAAQAIEKKGEITIRTFFEKNLINVEISDTGCGMDENTLKKLFTPFFTTKKIGKGSGLGLSISFKIIAKHKGSISVKSEKGRGSVFLVSLPSEGLKEDD